MVVTEEYVHDNRALPGLVDVVIKSDGMTPAATIDKLFAHGAYGNNDIYGYLGDYGILPNQSNIQFEQHGKKETSFETCSLVSEKCLQKRKDGCKIEKRLIVETVFSSIRRMFGEDAYSVRLKNIVQEMMLKASLYNKMMSV